MSVHNGDSDIIIRHGKAICVPVESPCYRLIGVIVSHHYTVDIIIIIRREGGTNHEGYGLVGIGIILPNDRTNAFRDKHLRYRVQRIIVGIDCHIKLRHHKTIGAITIVSARHDLAIHVDGHFHTIKRITSIAGHTEGDGLSCYFKVIGRCWASDTDSASTLGIDMRRDTVRINTIYTSAFNNNKTNVNHTFYGSLSLSVNDDSVRWLQGPVIICTCKGIILNVILLLKFSETMSPINLINLRLDVAVDNYDISWLNNRRILFRSSGRRKGDVLRIFGNAHQGLSLVDRYTVYARRNLERIVEMARSVLIIAKGNVYRISVHRIAIGGCCQASRHLRPVTVSLSALSPIEV